MTFDTRGWFSLEERFHFQFAGPDTCGGMRLSRGIVTLPNSSHLKAGQDDNYQSFGEN